MIVFNLVKLSYASFHFRTSAFGLLHLSPNLVKINRTVAKQTSLREGMTASRDVPIKKRGPRSKGDIHILQLFKDYLD